MNNCPKCNAPGMIAVQYHHTSKNHIDGPSEWFCFKCKYRQGRWTGKELKEGEEELRCGKGYVELRESQ